MNKNDYLKIGKATDLTGSDRKLYRVFEILPGILSWTTLLGLVLFSFLKPVWVAYFIIAFDVYWLLLVVYLGIHLFVSYRKMKENLRIDWKARCRLLPGWDEIYHLVILPTYKESYEVIRPSVSALLAEGYPGDKIIVVLAIEEREGAAGEEKARRLEKEFAGSFFKFLVTRHPDGIPGELKGKGANQSFAAREAKEKIIDPEKIDYDKILVSVFDIDTIIYPGYFYRLTHAFLTVPDPYRASYQPIPLYHNNVWRAPFFARVAASSNTFWQMMQQVRQEKLATYSSHSMTWRALYEMGFWSTSMVSEDSRIFWHGFCYYNGDYRVEPLYFPLSMDVTMDKNPVATMKSLYRQQRRWGWGVENVPYLCFNFIKNFKTAPKGKYLGRIFVQVYGFHSWATNALIIGVIGWLPVLIGGHDFNAMVISSNLPFVTRTLMTFAMIGLVFSAVISTLLLPPRPKHYGFLKSLSMFLQWLVLPVSIIVFGSIPGIEAQTRLALGKYLGFFVTPKER